MATTFLTVDPAKRLGAELRQLVRLLRSCRDQLEQIKGVMDTQVDGADYTQVATEFGLQAGQGQTAYNLVAGAFTAVNVSAVQQLIDRMG
jgi:hypothetical protein